MKNLSRRRNVDIFYDGEFDPGEVEKAIKRYYYIEKWQAIIENRWVEHKGLAGTPKSLLTKNADAV